MELPYRIIEHTADTGLEAFGKTLPEAFVNAAKGMFSILVSKVHSHENDFKNNSCAEKSFSIEVFADSKEELLVGWLNKLLYLWDAEQVVFYDFEILKLDNFSLFANAKGELLNPQKHKVKTYIKAATYYQTLIREKGDKVLVRVFFDV
jgi:SHS2 domain-containing protein